MTGKKFKGYLDRLRENVEVLDEQIANARKMSRPKGKADKAAALQWAKTVRDLVELRNTTLGNIKTHLLGRDESGAACEPPEVYDGNSEIEFERAFERFLSPWTQKDLSLKCQDCGRESEEVSAHVFSGEPVDLCPGCYEKRENDSLPECEGCGVKSAEVSRRRSPTTWVAGVMLPGDIHNLCRECDRKRQDQENLKAGVKELKENPALRKAEGLDPVESSADERGGES